MNSGRKALLELRGVGRRYTQGESVIDVLRGASLSLRGGEMTALVGPSGSGKSTLLNIAGLLERPDEGEVLVDGAPTSALGSRRRGRLRAGHVGFVFQFHRLLPEFSAIENVMIPQMLNGLGRGEAETRSEQLLGMVGLANRREHVPAPCRAASSSVSPSPARWPTRRASCWPTSRLGTLIRRPPPRCSATSRRLSGAPVLRP